MLNLREAGVIQGGEVARGALVRRLGYLYLFAHLISFALVTQFLFILRF